MEHLGQYSTHRLNYQQMILKFILSVLNGTQILRRLLILITSLLILQIKLFVGIVHLQAQVQVYLQAQVSQVQVRLQVYPVQVRLQVYPVQVRLQVKVQSLVLPVHNHNYQSLILLLYFTLIHMVVHLQIILRIWLMVTQEHLQQLKGLGWKLNY